jgi:hypothetical protein
MSDELIDILTVISSFYRKEQLSLTRSYLARIQMQMTVKITINDIKVQFRSS